MEGNFMLFKELHCPQGLLELANMRMAVHLEVMESFSHQKQLSSLIQ